MKDKLEVPESFSLKTLEDYKSYYEDTTKEEILKDTYIDYCAYVNLAHEYAKLKKQLEEKQNPFKGIFAQVNDDILLRNCGNMNAEINELKNQQKEFIEYLENEIENQKSEIFENSLTSEDIDLYIMRVKLLKYEEILSRYKEIIGGKDE